MSNTKCRTFAARPYLGLLVIVSLAVVGASWTAATATAKGLELIPSFGITKSTAADAGNANGFGGLALRAPLAPMIKIEGGIAYRQDSFSGGAVKVRQWPVTASLWLSPISALYLGGGVGWYRTTLDYPSTMPIQDTTTSRAGLHLGGGLDLPLAPRLSLDLNGRYIFMTRDKASFDVPTTFNPDYWTTSLGLAIAF